jgi:hypothetical protein
MKKFLTIILALSFTLNAFAQVPTQVSPKKYEMGLGLTYAFVADEANLA